MSIRDDVLNTRYYSHYDMSKKEEKCDKAEAINKIESHLDILKQ